MSRDNRTVIIGGIEYVPREADGELKIVVLDRGFVVVGRVSTDGDYVVIDSCHCVRRWGTTHGLGELAVNGPLKATVLDAQPRTRVHKLQVIQTIDCREESWRL